MFNYIENPNLAVKKLSDVEVLKRRQEISCDIEKALDTFEKSPKELGDFNRLAASVIGLNVDRYEKEDVDRSWNPDQISRLIGSCELLSTDDLNKIEPMVFDLLFHFFTTSSKKSLEESDTVSDLFAEAIIEKANAGEPISLFLQERISIWAQSIQMVNPKIRINLLAKIFNNPGIFFETLRLEVASNLAVATIDNSLIKNLEDQFQNNEGNFYVALRIVDVLGQLKRIGVNSGFEDSARDAHSLLESIYKKYDNYFIKTRIEQLSEPLSQKLQMEDDLNNENIKELVPPLEAAKFSSEEQAKEFIDNCAYNFIGDNYAAIYNPKGGIDSFILISDKKNETKRITLPEILQREGFSEAGKSREEIDLLINNYRALLQPELRRKIEAEFDFFLKDINIRTQIQFLNFISTKNQKEIESVIEFINHSEDAKLARLKSFLSLELDKTNGDKIIGIGGKLRPEDADKVFAKIAEIVDKTEEDVENLVDTKNAEIDPNAVRLKLLERVHGIILKFSESDDENIENLLRNLESSKVRIDVLSSLLQVAKDNGVKLTPENINGMKIESHEVGELSGEKGKMFRERYEESVMEMMRKSYAKIFADNPEAREKVENNFKERFENLEKYRVYVLMFQGEAAAFSVIDPNNTKDCEEGEVMSESTIVHPDVTKGSLGIAFLKKIFEEEFKKYGVRGIRGKVRVGHPAGESYNKIGLVVDKSRPTWKENGVEYESRIANNPNARLEKSGFRESVGK